MSKERNSELSADLGERHGGGGALRFPLAPLAWGWGLPAAHAGPGSGATPPVQRVGVQRGGRLGGSSHCALGVKAWTILGLAGQAGSC